MGKKLRQQRRGKGTNVYRKLPGTFDVSVSYGNKPMVGEVVEFINSTGHTAPLMKLQYDDFSYSYMIAPEGIKIGDKVYINTVNFSLGSVMKLIDIPEGMPIYNIESMPGDGGKYARTAGSSAVLSAHMGSKATIVMPSKMEVTLDANNRAQLGVTAGGGITEQQLLKAGKNFYRMHAINRTWPTNRGVKMNPVDHPFGGKQHHKGKSSMTSRNAPPGRKVGHIAARRVGRKKK
jgi:large subunit ribosomal protein L2